MDKKSFEDAQERLFEINKVIEKLDPSIRAGAFELLKAYVKSGSQSHSTEAAKHSSASPSNNNDVDLASLIEKHGNEKPSDNAHLLAADWYRRYGSAPFSLESLKQAGDSSGLTLPERPDMTLKAAQDGGKKLYQSAGHGLYKPTVTGELYLKKTYGVTKGNETPPMAAKP
jgi:hypothetical protein